MTISSKSIRTRNHIRSISLPSSSHPNMVRFEQKLNCLKAKLVVSPLASIPSGWSICKSLNGLLGLYKCVDNLLNLPLTQQAISQCHDERRVDGLLDGSVRVLDTCGLARDIVSHVKEHFRDVQCALRRRKGDSSIDQTIVSDYRKKVKKEAKRGIANLKQVDRTMEHYSSDHDLDHHFIVVIRLLMEISEMTTKVFESIFQFSTLVLSPKPKPSRWSIVSKMTLKGTTVNCEDLQLGDMNKLVALINLSKSNPNNEGVIKMMHKAQNRMEVMEAQIESMDIGLESLFRCLVRTRALLLNIVSQ